MSRAKKDHVCFYRRYGFKPVKSVGMRTIKEMGDYEMVSLLVVLQHSFLKSTHKFAVQVVCISGSLSRSDLHNQEALAPWSTCWQCSIRGTRSESDTKVPEGKDSSSQWIFPEHLLAVLSSSAEDCSRRKDCPGSGKEQAGHCQPPGAHCIALSLVRCVGGEGESKAAQQRFWWVLCCW